jgi:hypothetical protein
MTALIYKGEVEERLGVVPIAASRASFSGHFLIRLLSRNNNSYKKIARLYPERDLCNRVIHCGVATPAIQKRLKELSVLVDSNPPFVYWIGSWFEKYGPERVRWSYPAKSYFDNGIIVSDLE